MGKPDMLQSMGSQRVGHNLLTEQQQQQHNFVKDEMPCRREFILMAEMHDPVKNPSCRKGSASALKHDLNPLVLTFSPVSLLMFESYGETETVLKKRKPYVSIRIILGCK